MNLSKTEDYHEDYGPCLFFSFSRDSEGNILGEPQDVMFSYGYLEDDFDDKKWTHFIADENFNFAFEQADPENFKPLKSQG